MPDSVDLANPGVYCLDGNIHRLIVCIMKNQLKTDYEKSCNAYLKAFCEKHGYDYETSSWEDVGCVAEVCDYYVGMGTIRTDIDLDAPEDEFLKYYDYCLRVGGIANGEISTPNYRSWLVGCPRMSEDQIARLEVLQEDIRLAKEAMVDGIRNEVGNSNMLPKNPYEK